MRWLSSLLAAALLTSCSLEIPTRFDAVRWRKADLSTRERARMVPDLLRRHPLIGMTSGEVRALLGPPTGSEREWQLVYVLGPDGTMFPIDNEWLLMRLDDRSIVTKYVVRDD